MTNRVTKRGNVFVSFVQLLLKQRDKRGVANGESKRTYERDPSLVGCSACRAGTRDLSLALPALVGQLQNIFSSPCTISTYLSPSPSKLGRQPCWVACLLLCVSVLKQGSMRWKSIEKLRCRVKNEREKMRMSSLYI